MARPILHRKLIDEAGGTEEMVIWDVPAGVKAPDRIRYRPAYIPKGSRDPAVLYDNHYPKGHHRHIRGHETAYEFAGVEKLLKDFRKDIEAIK